MIGQRDVPPLAPIMMFVYTAISKDKFIVFWLLHHQIACPLLRGFSLELWGMRCALAHRCASSQGQI